MLARHALRGLKVIFMAVECVFYLIKTDGITTNEKALELFNEKPRIRNYCMSQKECPNSGIIEKEGHFHSGTGGFVPLVCYKRWLSGIVANVAQDVADSYD